MIGPRQVGKTTLLRHLAGESRTYVTLDDPLVRALARQDPALFLQRFQPPLLLDEVQYAPELLTYIKMQVDRDRRPGSFWLTGSQQFHLMKGVSESLAGRVGILTLLGFSQREIVGAPFAPPFGRLLTIWSVVTAVDRAGCVKSLSRSGEGHFQPCGET